MQDPATTLHFHQPATDPLIEGEIYTQSMYVQAIGGLTQVNLISQPISTGVVFDLTGAGAIVGTAPSIDGRPAFKGSITNEGNGWYRISATYQAINTTDHLSLFQYQGGNWSGFAGVATDGVAVWGMQTVLGEGAVPHVQSSGAPVTADTVISAQELASGFGLQVDVASAAAGDRVEVGYLNAGNFTSFSTPVYSQSLAGPVAKLNINVNGVTELADGEYTLVTRLVNEVGVAGAHSTAGATVTVDTADGQTVNDIGMAASRIRGGVGDDTIAGNGGNDTINISQGGSDTLVFNAINTADARFGNGTDTVTGFISNFDGALDANEDKIDLTALIAQIETDVGGGLVIDANNIGDYLSASNVGGNTTLKLDRDGAGGAHSSTDFLHLQGVVFDSTHLSNMVTSGQIFF
jgi:hypothetical protein